MSLAQLPPADDRGAGLLSSPVRRRIVDTLHALSADSVATESAALTAAQLAEHLDLHVTTVRFHLDQLVAAGLVTTAFERTHSVGRPSKVYAVAAGSLDPGQRADSLQLLTGLLAATFGARDSEGRSQTPAAAGRRWVEVNVPVIPGAAPADTPGTWLGKIGRMIDVLREWGYTPQISTADGGRTARVTLTQCPFLDLAREHPAVVCGIHRGLIAGAMDRLGETDTTVSLEPFVEPDVCLAHVTTHAPFVPPRGETP